MLTGRARRAEIEQMQHQASGLLNALFLKLSRNLSYIEVFALTIAAIEARAGITAEEIMICAADITASYRGGTRCDLTSAPHKWSAGDASPVDDQVDGNLANDDEEEAAQ